MTFRFSFIFYVLILNFILKLTFFVSFFLLIYSYLMVSHKQPTHNFSSALCQKGSDKWFFLGISSWTFQFPSTFYYAIYSAYQYTQHAFAFLSLIFCYNWQNDMYLFHVQGRQGRCKVVLIYLISHDQNHSQCLPWGI